MMATSITSVLSCNELLHMIFQELKPVYLSQEAQDSLTPAQLGVFADKRQKARCDLLSATRVCRAFSEHALDALWEVIECIEPLLHVLPSHRRLSSPLDVFPLLTLDKWDRLQSYARRVKELHHECSCFDCACSSIVPILLSKFRGAPLFPRLKLLKALALDGETATYTIPLLSSTLRSITVACDEDIGAKNCANFETVLCALHVTSPDIRELVLLDENKSGFSIGERHIKSLSDLRHLRRFTSRVPLDSAAWKDMGTLPFIQHLDITINKYGSTSSDTSSLVLPDLRSLTLRGPLKDLSDFLGRSEFPVLRSASFRVDGSPLPVLLKGFFKLAKDKLPPTLRQFSLRCESVTNPEGSYPRDTSNKLLLDLRPLGAFAQLEELHIDLGEQTAVHVSDRDIRTLAKALPRLVSLTLRCNPGPYGGLRRRPTVASLVALATRCPRLACLHLSDLDVADLDVYQDSAENGCSSQAKLLTVPALDHKLRELEISFFRTKTRGGVFEFAEKLDRLFPNLVNVRSLDVPTESRVARMSDYMWSSWDVTKACIGYLQNVRRNSVPLATSCPPAKATSDSVVVA